MDEFPPRTESEIRARSAVRSRLGRLGRLGRLDPGLADRPDRPDRPGRPVRPGRPARRARRVLVAGLLALGLVLTGGVAWALWRDSGTAAGPGALTSWMVPPAVTTCTDTDGGLLETAAVSWPEVTDPHALDYTATINGFDAPVVDDGDSRRVVINMTTLREILGGLVSGTLTVEVTATLPGTAWTGPVSTETIRATVSLPSALALECGPGQACTATLVVENQWAEGFQANVYVTAGDTALTSWSTTFDIGPATIDQQWNAEFSASSGRITASNLDWNGNLAPGGTTVFGFVALGPLPDEVPVSCTGA